jgi:uncharacterized protein (TIGR03435 family)
MQKLRNALVIVAVPICICMLASLPTRAQQQTQNTSTISPDFKYEVVSVKPNKSGNFGRTQITSDGLTMPNVSLQFLIQFAFGIQDFQFSGMPGWLNSERFDIDAKMDPAVADALQKLSPDDQKLARQKMLQALLADRFQLTIHRETRELQVYSLTVAKNGPKLHEAKSGDTYANGIKYPNGGGGPGAVMLRMGPTSQTMSAQAVPISTLVRQFVTTLRSPILDKTGLTGKYDFTLTWTPEDQMASGGVPNGQPAIAAPDPSGATLFTALQEQLGLKLESGKGPVEMIVIDHVERPSGN